MVMKERSGLLDYRSEFSIAVGVADRPVIVAIGQEWPIDKGAIVDAGFEEVGERIPWELRTQSFDPSRLRDVLRYADQGGHIPSSTAPCRERGASSTDCDPVVL